MSTAGSARRRKKAEELFMVALIHLQVAEVARREVGSEIELLSHNRGNLPNTTVNTAVKLTSTAGGISDISDIYLKLLCLYLCAGFRAPLPVGEHIRESERLRPLGDEVGQWRAPLVHLWDTKTHTKKIGQQCCVALTRQTPITFLLSVLPLQYRSAVSMAHLRSLCQRLQAGAGLSICSGSALCHR